MVTLEGNIEEITFYSEETGFMVFVLAHDQEYDTCVGVMPAVAAGESITVTGEWVAHKVYGNQLKVASFTLRVPTDLEDIRRYLASGIIYGIGKVTADRLITEFGEDTLTVLSDHPELVAGVRGIGKKRAQKICDSYHEHMASREVMIQLTHFGVSPNQALKLYLQYGNDAVSILKTNPYRMIEDIAGIGFKTADGIALGLGIEKESAFRLKAGINYTLSWGCSQGHVYLPKELLLAQCTRMLEVDREQIAGVLDGMIQKGNVDTVDEDIYLPAMYRDEVECAKRIVGLTVFGNRIEDAKTLVDEEAKAFAVKLSQEQIQAVEQAVYEPCSIITGGPGTGKTTIIQLAIQIFTNKQLRVFLCAPTGRAAKRMAEATGYAASTIHRLLEYGGEGHFMKNADSPIEADVLIVDEMSMVDVNLMHMLISAVPSGAKLILIGDADQLMSVGAGNVLRELIQSGCVPTSRLTKVYRQGEGSLIVDNAHRINQGDLPVAKTNSDFTFVELDDVQETLQKLKKYFLVMKKRIDQQALYGIQVLSPTKKGELGVLHINQQLQDILNPPGPKEYRRGDTIFRVGDKVMQIKNNYQIEWTDGQGRRDKGVFNGDMGVVTDLDLEAETLEVLFDDERFVDYALSELDQLQHAYCLSVHKSQGSEFDTVLLLLNGPAPLMTRNLLYTAVTRAKKRLYLLGSRETLARMIANNYISHRYTHLGEFIQKNHILLTGESHA